MTVLHVKTGRAIWLVDARDLNPRGIDMMPILAAVKDRYKFQVYPKTAEDANEDDTRGIVFELGSFGYESGIYTITKATVFNDGIVVNTGLSTRFAEAFLADLLEFVSSKFGLTYRPDMVHTRIYTSELIVRTDKDFSRLFAPLDSIKEKLNSLTKHHFEPAGFGFSIDSTASSARPVPFRFEREVGKPFSQNRYYSAAPVHTSQHEELLREMEALL